MIAPARVAAYEILRAVTAGGADLPAAIATARTRLTDERDAALAAEIATGVQRWRAALDHVISAFARRPLERLDGEVVEVLRLSAYQLLHLTRVPAAAVVDDGVDLTRRAGKTSAGGFVNAVLRAISRSRRNLPLPRRPDAVEDTAAALDYLSITLSHPRWLAARWLDRLGLAAAEAWMIFNNSPAPLTLRTNELRIARDELVARFSTEGIRVRPGRYATDALIVEEGHPLRGEGVERGWFVVQDEASQLVAQLTNPRPSTLVLDTCASPGGKTTAMAAMMGGSGRIVASDLRERRVQLLRRAVAASGATNIALARADLLRSLPFRRRFDLVVVDAPCSGLGTLRRDPDIRWRRSEDDLAALAAGELTMLQHAADVVSSGGRLVYATCSSEPEENEGVVSAFLASTPDFVQLHAHTAAPALPAAVIDERGCLRTQPHLHGLEAFFGAVFTRR